ncbi:TPA: helix-turn-helix transcriptional regulator [Escherichia coli]|nr:helix-turn-helix transcriptional regulator [Escherichia coli]
MQSPLRNVRKAHGFTLQHVAAGVQVNPATLSRIERLEQIPSIELAERFVSLPDVEDVDNADINQRLLEVIEQIGSYSKQIRSAIEDGVVEPHEKTAINDELYLSISKLQEHAALVYKIFCISESNDARECAAPGAVACRDCGETNA